MEKVQEYFSINIGLCGITFFILLPSLNKIILKVLKWFSK